MDPGPLTQLKPQNAKWKFGQKNITWVWLHAKCTFFVDRILWQRNKYHFVCSLRTSYIRSILGRKTAFFSGRPVPLTMLQSWEVDLSPFRLTHDPFTKLPLASPTVATVSSPRHGLWCGTQIRGNGKLPKTWSLTGIQSTSQLWMASISLISSLSSRHKDLTPSPVTMAGKGVV